MIKSGEMLIELWLREEATRSLLQRRRPVLGRWSGETDDFNEAVRPSGCDSEHSVSVRAFYEDGGRPKAERARGTCRG